MFRTDQIHRVNRERVGDYPAGTLLILAPDTARHRAIPWNLLPHPSGGHVLALDATGQPAYLATDVTPEQLQGATVEPDPQRWRDSHRRGAEEVTRPTPASEEPAMTPYGNVGGASGVAAYEVTPDSITVRFADGWHYLYDHASTGEDLVEQMKGLAAAGQGLNSFINQVVRKGYARKWR